MVDSQRNLFIIAFLFISFIIWETWKQDKNSQLKQQNSVLPIKYNNNISHDNKENFNSGKSILIKTDVLQLKINTLGGAIEQASLLKYPSKLNSTEPFQLLKTTSEYIFQAYDGLSGPDGPDSSAITNSAPPIYNVYKHRFNLGDNQNTIILPMYWIDHEGNKFVKTFIIKRGEYTVNINYSITNVTTRPLMVLMFGQLNQTMKIPSDNYVDVDSFFKLHSFRGAAYSACKEKYKKYKFDNIANNKNLDIKSNNGWIAMLQQYFTAALIPRNDRINNFYTKNLGNGTVAIGYKSSIFKIQPRTTSKLRGSTLWVGPKIQDKMAAVAPYLDLTVDYGWLWFISQPLFKMLKFINSFIHNWGLSIIIITLVVRGIMYPLTKTQYISMAKMRILQPQIQSIRERTINNKQKQNQEIIALYKAEKVNPLGGCLPVLIQMPIFLALYYMLVGSIELRHAPFIFWIYDLSAKDQYYVLPILMGITTFFIQRMSLNNETDMTQQKIIFFMPVIFTVFFLWFPSGLVLYYIVSNIVTIIQQELICRGFKKSSLYV